MNCSCSPAGARETALTLFLLNPANTVPRVVRAMVRAERVGWATIPASQTRIYCSGYAPDATVCQPDTATYRLLWA